MGGVWPLRQYFTPRPHFPWLSCDPPIKLSILGEAVDEWHEGIAYLHQASALMRGTRPGGLVLMGFNAWSPCEQKIAPEKGAAFYLL